MERVTSRTAPHRLRVVIGTAASPLTAMERDACLDPRLPLLQPPRRRYLQRDDSQRRQKRAAVADYAPDDAGAVGLIFLPRPARLLASRRGGKSHRRRNPGHDP